LAAFFLVGAICFEMGYRFGVSSLLSSKDAQASVSPSVETSSAAANSTSTALEPELVSVTLLVLWTDQGFTLLSQPNV